jgi:hypothetical protein
LNFLLAVWGDVRTVKERDFDDSVITRYLLGELPPQETERLDQLGFTDEDFVLRLQLIENDLVDAYARGDLQPPLLERFTSVYLSSPKRRDKVKFAQALFKVVPAMQPKRAGWQSLFTIPTFGWQTALAMATLLLLVTTSWLALENRRLRAERNALAVARPPVQEKQPPEDRLPSIVAFNLLPPTRGVAGLQTLAVPPDTDFVSVQAELETGQYPSYRAELRSLPRKELVWKSASVKRHGITIPAATLQPGTYVLEVFGATAGGTEELLGSYPFRVTQL